MSCNKLIENCRRVQNGGHYRPKNHVTKRFKMIMFFNYCVWMQVYSTEGFSLLHCTVYCLAAIKDLRWQLLFGWSYNPLVYVVTEHSNSGFPSFFFCKASTTISKLLTGLFVLVNIYKDKWGDIHLISFLYTKFKEIRLYEVQDH